MVSCENPCARVGWLYSSEECGIALWNGVERRGDGRGGGISLVVTRLIAASLFNNHACLSFICILRHVSHVYSPYFRAFSLRSLCSGLKQFHFSSFPLDVRLTSEKIIFATKHRNLLIL